MAETKVAKKTKKSKESIQETEVKVSALAVKETTLVEDDVKVDVEIDCTTNCCSNSPSQGTYIRRKRLI